MRQRTQANRQQQIFNMCPNNGRNRTYPLMTASYSGQRYPSQPVPAATRIHVPTSSYQPHHQHNLAPPDRIARSPLPPEEMEPMAPPNTRFPPHPHLNQPGDFYPQFTEPQLIHQQQHHEAHLPQCNLSQQVYSHPSIHPSAAQPPFSQAVHQTSGGGGGEGYNTASYPPQAMLRGQQYSGCVPPPAPVEAVYPVSMEGGAYYKHQVPPVPDHHHDVLMLNTPTGVMMENLLPSMPPPLTGLANTSCAAAAPQALPPATSSNYHHEPETGEAESHRLPGSSPQYPQSYGLLSSTAASYGRSSKDILCGQGGN